MFNTKLKARDFGWIHLQQNSYSHHIYSLQFVRLKGQKIPQAKVMALLQLIIHFS